MKNLINFTSWAPFAVVLFWFTAIPFPGFWASGPVYPLIAYGMLVMAGWMMYISGRKRYEISKRQWYKQAIRDKVQNTDCLQSYSANVADWTDDRHETAALEDRYNNLCKLARASQDTLTARSKLQA